MTEWFADTFFFLALRNPRDQSFASARAKASEISRVQLVTTEWVLVEVAAALSQPKNRQGFGLLLGHLNAQNAVIVPSDASLFKRGVELYDSRPDKGWSLTDCISFLVMEERGMSEVLTGDHHFTQAGFKILLD